MYKARWILVDMGASSILFSTAKLKQLDEILEWKQWHRLNTFLRFIWVSIIFRTKLFRLFSGPNGRNIASPIPAELDFFWNYVRSEEHQVSNTSDLIISHIQLKYV